MSHASMNALQAQANLSANAGGSGFDSRLFERARSRARRGQFWAMLTGRARGLLALGQLLEFSSFCSQSDGGTSFVPISQIRGTEGRDGYFDREFDPLQDQARERWQGIARAMLAGKRLPPVLLTQAGDLYFVSDGHHRISVARALGQRDIEARVTILPVSGPLPWDETQVDRGPKSSLNGLKQWVALTLQGMLPFAS